MAGKMPLVKAGVATEKTQNSELPKKTGASFVTLLFVTVCLFPFPPFFCKMHLVLSDKLPYAGWNPCLWTRQADYPSGTDSESDCWVSMKRGMCSYVLAFVVFCHRSCSAGKRWLLRLGAITKFRESGSAATCHRETRFFRPRDSGTWKH